MSKSSIGWRKAGISSLATAALVAGACVAGAGAASANTSFQFNRLNGTDRYGTSALTAKEFGTANDVILASGLPGHYPDALAANYLAGTMDAPVLLTKKDSTPPSILQAIKDAGADTVWIVGGTGVITQAQEDSLVSAGYTVHRIAGQDRFDTATQVIDQGGTSSGEGIVATGLNFPDALGAGPLAYAKGMPLAISKTFDISDAEITALKNAGVSKVLVVGGTKAVSNAVVTKLEANGIHLDQRLSGTDRAATAEAVANYELKNGFTNTAVNVASGFEQGDGADALGGGALSGSTKTPMLITNSDVKPGAATLDYLMTNANTLADGYLFGGTAAISQGAQDQMEAAAQQVNSNQSYTVSPQDKATLGATGGDDSARTYTVTGLDDTETYQIGLFEAGNVDTSSPRVTFADANPNDGVADQGNVSAVIASVNNKSGSASDSDIAVPVNGVVKFTIKSGSPDDVVPVVWLDNTGGTGAGLDLSADDTPSEAFGVGGETVYTPQAATAAPVTDAGVISNDEDANTFVAETTPGTASTARTFAYDSNDTFTLAGTTPHQITMADFEKDLNAGDTVSATYYYADSSLSTQWTLTDAAPTEPTITAVAPTSGSESSSMTINWTAPVKGVADSYNVYRATTAAAIYPDDYTLVGSTSGDTTKYVDNGLKASTAYYYVVTAVEQGQESGESNQAGNVTAATPAPALKIKSASVTTDNITEGAPDDGDVWTLVFDADASDAAASGTVYRLVDGNGDTYQVECGAGDASTVGPQVDAATGSAFCEVGDATGSASGSKDQVTITLVTSPDDRNAAGDGKLTYPSTITDVTGANVDLAGSADKTVN